MHNLIKPLFRISIMPLSSPSGSGQKSSSKNESASFPRWCWSAWQQEPARFPSSLWDNFPMVLPKPNGMIFSEFYQNFLTIIAIIYTKLNYTVFCLWKLTITRKMKEFNPTEDFSKCLKTFHQLKCLRFHWNSENQKKQVEAGPRIHHDRHRGDAFHRLFCNLRIL